MLKIKYTVPPHSKITKRTNPGGLYVKWPGETQLMRKVHVGLLNLPTLKFAVVDPASTSPAIQFIVNEAVVYARHHLVKSPGPVHAFIGFLESGTCQVLGMICCCNTCRKISCRCYTCKCDCNGNVIPRITNFKYHAGRAGSYILFEVANNMTAGTRYCTGGFDIDHTRAGCDGS